MFGEALQKHLGTVMVLAGNSVPLYGVFFWGWDIFSVFFLYWAENVIVGFFVLLMMLAYSIGKGGFGRVISGLARMPFFCVHYGLFCFVHVAILTELFGGDLHVRIANPLDVLALIRGQHIQGFYWGLIGIFVAEAFQCFYSYAVKYSKVKEVSQIMAAPYGRIIVLHITILAGGLLAQMLGSPVWALVVLIVFKTLYDTGKVYAGKINDTASENSGGVRGQDTGEG